MNRRRLRELAEAIREGAKKRPQSTGNYFAEGGSCALGAAAEGIGFNPAISLGDDEVSEFLSTHFPVLRCRSRHTKMPLAEWIILSNDVRRLSREQIADLVEAGGIDGEFLESN